MPNGSTLSFASTGERQQVLHGLQQAMLVAEGPDIFSRLQTMSYGDRCDHLR